LFLWWCRLRFHKSSSRKHPHIQRPVQFVGESSWCCFNLW
jgi:hypothetical protein